MPQRHIPERTCVACRSLRPKREMVRVVRTTDGTVVVDPTGKRSGRGAYVCGVRECWDVALRRKALDRALKTELSRADREALASYQQSAISSQEPVVSSRESPANASTQPTG
jgi:predicted RNA-binding protein YlxR (DUF448 family)